MDRVHWKLDDSGRRSRLPASYIMANDRHAEAAFQALRARGLSKKEAELEIERCFECCWHEQLLCDPPPPDARPACWVMLGEGMRLESIFPNKDTVGLTTAGGGLLQ
jgi:hypothetical protein